MISLIVFIILILFFIYLAHTLFSSGLTFFINISIIALAATKATTDIKKDNMYGFYLASSLAAVIVFIAKDARFIAPIFDFFSKAYVLPMSIALIFILFFAHAFKLGNIYGKEYGKKLIELCKQKISELRK